MNAPARCLVALSALLVCLSLTLPSQAASSSLQDAYKKEFAFLEAEKRALKKRLKELASDTARRERQARGQIGTLNATLTQLQAQARELEATLDRVEGNAGAGAEDSARLEEAMDRARLALEEAGVTLPDAPKPSEEGGSVAVDVMSTYSQMLIETSLKLVGRQDSVWTEEGAFFLSDGRETKGRIVHLGDVARYGSSDDGSGVLAPAGSGRFKLWPVDTSQSAQALASGAEMPPEFSLFLYESALKAIEQKEEKTALMIIESGGVIAWVIVYLGALAMLLAFVRLCMLAWFGVGTRAYVLRALDALKVGGVPQALAAAKDSRLSVSRVLKATVGHVQRTREELDSAIEESILVETPRIERFSSAMVVIAAVAPLLGLLGTVTGMISTFDVITEYGTGDPKMLSGGISEALVTTELGLIVAIPTLMLGAFLSAWGDGLLTKLEAAALRMTNQAAKQGLREPQALIDISEQGEAA
jgi:biopolymer transport protein ExbB